MAKRTKTQFKALYGTAGTLFPDNTVGAISEADVRAFGEDIADTFGAQADGIASVVATTSGTITLNFDSTNERVFVGSSSFATPKTVALSNSTYASILEFVFEVTNVAAVLTWPAAFLMNDVRWDGGAKTWTPDGTGKFKAKATFDGTNWLLDISQPYA